MRRFHSYGPVNMKLHYYAPREALIDRAYTHLMGEYPDEGGHFITVWAPRQCCKTWTMQQILFRLQKDDRFDVLKINLENLKSENDAPTILDTIAREIGDGLDKPFTGIDSRVRFQEIFKKDVLEKPLILILDEFDALGEEGINAVVRAFRNIYIRRLDESQKKTGQKTYLLHGVALIGVRSVLGIESQTGSPFNIQRSVHIPNLTFAEVEGMFKWYEKESGQKVLPEVIAELYGETRGQPGLIGWFGELLTETYNEKPGEPITMDNYQRLYEAAVYLLPNVNILNIISKADTEPYKDLVFDMFRTDELLRFKFDDKRTNFLYMNGVIEPVEVENKNYIRFSSPFVQKRLFNYFSNELFNYMGRLLDPMVDIDAAITGESLDIKNIIALYQTYLDKNRGWLFKNAPRRQDMRIFEAVFHFNIYMYLFKFVENRGGNVYPEFPTGNGKIDIVIEYKQKVYALELKSYSDSARYKKNLIKAVDYGKQLALEKVYLVFFIESIDKENRRKYETLYRDKDSGVMVIPIFVATGNTQDLL